VVVEQSERDQILEAQAASLSDCTDESCAVEIGKLLTADSIIIGTASKVGTKFYVTVRLVDVLKGKRLRAETVDAASVEGLADATGKLAEQVALDETTGGQGKLVTVEETAAASSGQQDARARAGEYGFVIQKELYESRALTLVVEEGKTTTASVSLEPAFVWLSVSEVNGLAASLYLDGKQAGTSPDYFELLVGEHEILVRGSQDR
jgi:hypothetical protein